MGGDELGVQALVIGGFLPELEGQSFDRSPFLLQAGVELRDGALCGGELRSQGAGGGPLLLQLRARVAHNLRPSPLPPHVTRSTLGRGRGASLRA